MMRGGGGGCGTTAVPSRGQCGKEQNDELVIVDQETMYS